MPEQEELICTYFLCRKSDFKLLYNGNHAFCILDVLCDSPEQIPNGDILTTSSLNPYLTVIHYQCHTGYALESGDLTRMCISNKEWSGVLPVCIGKFIE